MQRFGDIRPITHLVGEALARGKAEEAARIFLALPYAGEQERTREARERLWESGDIQAARNDFPGYLHHELAMLNYLAEHPGDYAHSFDVLSVNLKRLFALCACLSVIPLQPHTQPPTGKVDAPG